jgi:uncharacterized protein (DUF1501 family)
MKRKDFLRSTVPAVMIPSLIGGYSIKAHSTGKFLKRLARRAAINGRVLVVIEMNGGNDGLNMVIPVDQYSNLSTARSNVLIDETKALTLNGVTATKLHPAMTGLRDLYNEQKVCVIQNVGYPNPNFSHFRSMDIWKTASDSNVNLVDGWLGRYLNQDYPGYPDNYPNSTHTDPLAIQIGSSVSLSLIGPGANNMAMNISNPDEFYEMTNDIVDPAPNTPAGHELTFIRKVSQQTQEYLSVIKNASALGENKSTKYPASNSRNNLAEQLKIVARLIHGGLKTPLYYVNIGGFDTHAQQVDVADTSKGAHATLLGNLSDAITAFMDDCKLLKIDDKVAGMTFSEFGRRIQSNFSLGTDHGAAAPMFVFGNHVNPGIIGSNPTIPSTVNVKDNLPMEYDFRQVYASVLQQWFELDDETTDKDVMLKNFDNLPVFDEALSVKKSKFKAESGVVLEQNYPNPVKDKSFIQFNTPGGHIDLILYDAMGRKVKSLMQGKVQAGVQDVLFSREGLPAGNYYYQLSYQTTRITKAMVIQ